MSLIVGERRWGGGSSSLLLFLDLAVLDDQVQGPTVHGLLRQLGKGTEVPWPEVRKEVGGEWSQRVSCRGGWHL